MARSAGIDLGTSSVIAAVFDGVSPAVLLSKDGGAVTPAALCFDAGGELLVGEAAVRQQLLQPDRFVSGFCHLLGKAAGDPEIKRLAARVHGRLGPDQQGGVAYQAGGRPFRPQQLLAALLQRFKADAEEQLLDSLDSAVLSVPLGCNDAVRAATTEAAELGGLRVLQLVDETAAACLASLPGASGLALFFHFGGESCRAAVLELRPDQAPRPLSLAEDRGIGGRDFSRRLEEFVLAGIEREDGADLVRNPAAQTRLRAAVDKLKHDLSVSESARIKLPFLADGPRGPVHVDRAVGREAFRELTDDLLLRVRQVAQRAVTQAGVGPGSFQFLLPSGGACRSPGIQALLRELSGCSAEKRWNPDEAVAFGCAIIAERLSSTATVGRREQRSAYRIGVELADGRSVTLIERGSSLPAAQQLQLAPAGGGQSKIAVRVLVGDGDHARSGAELLHIGIEQMADDFLLQAQLLPDGSLLTQLADYDGNTIAAGPEKRFEWLVAEYTEREPIEGQAAEVRSDLEQALVALEGRRRTVLVDKRVQDEIEDLLRRGRLALARGGGTEGLLELVAKTRSQLNELDSA